MDYTKTQLEKLLEYATPIQAIAINAHIEHGSIAAAAKALKRNASSVSRALSAVSRAAAACGYAPEANLNHKTPSGFSIKRISTLTNKDGDTTEWVIKERDKEDQFFAFKEAVSAVCENIQNISTYISPKQNLSEDMLATYVIGDHHYGLLSWHGEVGEDYDINIANDVLRKATASLVASTPHTKEALILNTGDFFHDNTGQNATPKSGHALDVDGRFAKIIQTGFMLMVAVIETALTKHETVYVRNALGNHSFTAEIMMSEFLSAWFRTEPRVVIHKEPTAFFYKQFGKVLLGITHGDTVRPTALGELMAIDCEAIWSETKHRYWLLGHVHSKHVTEMRSCMVESFNTLAAKDVWHTESGYRSKRNMTAIIYHKEYGEVQRHTVDISSLS